jgi:glucose/arabinose dehydrogenase
MFIGGMVGEQLARLTLKGQRVVGEETLVPRMGRIRDVRQSLDGYIYLVTDDRDGKPTPIYRLEPVERTTVR